jgi:hypothetical protein
LSPTRLVTGDHPQWLDPADETYGGESIEDVVDRLAGHIGKSAADRGQNSFGVGVGVGVNSFQHGDPWLGHAQVGHP